MARKSKKKSGAGTKSLQHFPKPLLDDLIEGRWLPVVGAGFSRNAKLPPGKVMPLWDGLGKLLAEELPDYTYSGAVDATSAYAHEFSRARLIERVSKYLWIDKVIPGEAHQAFSKMPFDLVCTTNFDFLIEQQYSLSGKYCRPVIDGEHLSISTTTPGVTLLKFHGDLHHPNRMILTEEDFDGFLDKYPLIATYLANLLISRTAVLIGYSLDDPDLRHIWRVISDRLGSLRRPAYALLVDPGLSDVKRYERRGIKVIPLPGDKKDYGEILARVFDELSEFVRGKILTVSQVKEEASLNQLALPRTSQTRLCYFAIPLALHSFYTHYVFPWVRGLGLIPVTADDVVEPGSNTNAKIDALIERSLAVVVDASTTATRSEYHLAMQKLGEKRVLAVFDAQEASNQKQLASNVVIRPSSPFAEPDAVAGKIAKWLDGIVSAAEPELDEEPKRLLNLGEYRAAVIAAFGLLEAVLREQLEGKGLARHHEPLSVLIRNAVQENASLAKEMPQLTKWTTVRNLAVHTNTSVNKETAFEVVEGVLSIVAKLRT